MLQRETVLGEQTSATKLLGSGSQRLPVLTYPYARLGPRRVWAASGSVGTDAWPVVSAACNQLQTFSPSRRSQI